MSAPITVGYWNIRGLAAPLRMMVMYTGTPLNNASYDIPEQSGGGFDVPGCSWFAAKPELKQKNPLINLPYVIDGDVIVSQSNACMSYLGRKLGLWGKTEQDVVMCEELLCEIMDLRNKMVQFAYGKHDDVSASAARLLADISGPAGILQKLELCLARNAAGNNTFFVGSSATAPDFHAWEMLDQYSKMAAHFGHANPLANFPALTAFHQSFGALPDNAKYLASPLHAKLPMNNKMAAFGATPEGNPWSQGHACDWADMSGTF